MSEPVAADGVAEDGWHHVAEEQSAIDHRLEGEAVAHGERHAPVGTHIAHTCLTVELGEVIRQVGILRIEPCTTGGEVPAVLGVEFQTGTVAEEMLIFELHLGRCLRAELIAVVHIIPTHT